MSSWFKSIQSNFTKIPNDDISRNPNLTVEEKALLLAIGSRDPSYPSCRDLQNDTGMAKRSVDRWKNSLRDQNVISWVRGNSHHKSNEYTINPSSMWNLLPIKTKKRKIKGGARKLKSLLVNGVGSAPRAPLIPIGSAQSEPPIISTNNNNNTNGSESAPGDSKLSVNVGSLDHITSKVSFGRRDSLNKSKYPLPEEIDSQNESISKGNNVEPITSDSSEICQPKIIVASRTYSLKEFEGECEHYGPDSPFAKQLLSDLIKSDYEGRVGFLDVQERIDRHQNNLSEGDLNRLIEEYSEIFREARRECEAANV